MNIWKMLTTEKCPHCNKTLDSPQNGKLAVIKSCPDGHYKKEINPFVESTIEYYVTK
jgi:hypothetical protein